MSEGIHPDDPRFVLLPCPFCGSDDIKKSARINFPVYTSCRNCGTEGPVRLTGREADQAWNERKEADTVDELNRLLARVKRLEEAGEYLDDVADAADDDIREHLQVANYNLHGLLNTGDRIEPPNPPQTIHQSGIDASVRVIEDIRKARNEWRKAKEAKP